jgi:NitT/TauT family transport system substrate-binding protein
VPKYRFEEEEQRTRINRHSRVGIKDRLASYEEFVMKTSFRFATVIASLVGLLSVASFATAQDATMEATAAGDLTPVSLQLQWVAQSQFAGYYAAKELGYYEEEGLDLTILEGAVEIVPQQVVASGGAEFGVAWVPKVLQSNEQGVNLVNIAQVFQRSGTLEVSFVDTGIESVEDFKGMRIGTWGYGNEHELFAAMRAAGIDPNNADDVTIVQQPFDMSLLLSGELDAAEAMTYNEYAQVLEQINPATGEMYTPEDLNVINFNDVGTAMLQDHLFVNADWLAEAGNGEIATAFLKASFRGWAYCRDNVEACVEIVLENGSTLGESHQTWQLNEINKLIWPSPAGIGIMDADLWQQTVDVALEGEVITAAPADTAYTTEYAQAALDELMAEYPDLDLMGAEYEPITVELREGGE